MGSYDVIFVIGFYYLYFKELVKNGLGIGFHHTDNSTHSWIDRKGYPVQKMKQHMPPFFLLISLRWSDSDSCSSISK